MCTYEGTLTAWDVSEPEAVIGFFFCFLFFFFYFTGMKMSHFFVVNFTFVERVVFLKKEKFDQL